MPAPGSTIGPYVVERELGRGGMGVVFLARDTRLGRAAALKALPEDVVSGAEELARFEREAKTLASLSHPNIAAIYGVEEAEGVRHLALEYVEGETLAGRLLRGPIAWRDVLGIGMQIAAGMEAAHEAGIVHRDLKPGNVMITADDRVKILDFGLAKAPIASGPPSGTLAHSPTLTHSPSTIPGVILGTAAYLSPEQARGKPVDRRTDIWAFGCVLYECLTGRAPFEGETVSDLIARILEREPDWSAIPDDAPPRLRALIERCLRKDARERLRDIGDARLELAEIAKAPGAIPTTANGGAARRGPGAPALWIGAALAAVIGTLLVLAGFRVFGPRGDGREVRRFSIPIPQGTLGFNHPPRLTADGRALLYAASNRIWVRSLDRFEPTEVAGTEGGYQYFWSPDGRRIAYYKDMRLWVADRTGTQTSTVCAIPGKLDINGGDWGRDGVIVFARYKGALYTVPASGGEPKVLLAPDSTELDFHHPQFLPDGRHLITVAHRKAGPQALVAVSYPEGKRRDLGTFDRLSTARYDPSGVLLLSFSIATEEFRAVPFDATRLRVKGTPTLVAAGGLYPSVSDRGLLAYYLGTSCVMREFVWVDRQGRVERTPIDPQPGLDHPAIAPDGRSIAAVTAEGGNADLWLFDSDRGTKTRLAAGPGDESRPRWTSDGAHLVYMDQQAYLSTLMELPRDRSAPPRRLGDGTWFTVEPGQGDVVFESMDGDRPTLSRLDRRGNGNPVSITLGAESREQSPEVSPDGKWIAYVSDEAGSFEVFVRRYPEGTQGRQISLHGGQWPFWARDGRSLYFWQHDTLMESALGSGTMPNLGAPRRLFTASEIGVEAEMDFRPPACDVTADGRFLMVRRVPGDPTSGILLVENWYEEFRKRLAAK